MKIDFLELCKIVSNRRFKSKYKNESKIKNDELAYLFIKNLMDLEGFKDLAYQRRKSIGENELYQMRIRKHIRENSLRNHKPIQKQLSDLKQFNNNLIRVKKPENFIGFVKYEDSTVFVNQKIKNEKLKIRFLNDKFRFCVEKREIELDLVNTKIEYHAEQHWIEECFINENLNRKIIDTLIYIEFLEIDLMVLLIAKINGYGMGMVCSSVLISDLSYFFQNILRFTNHRKYDIDRNTCIGLDQDIFNVTDIAFDDLLHCMDLANFNDSSERISVKNGSTSKIKSYFLIDFQTRRNDFNRYLNTLLGILEKMFHEENFDPLTYSLLLQVCFMIKCETCKAGHSSRYMTGNKLKTSPDDLTKRIIKNKRRMCAGLKHSKPNSIEIDVNAISISHLPFKNKKSISDSKLNRPKHCFDSKHKTANINREKLSNHLNTGSKPLFNSFMGGIHNVLIKTTLSSNSSNINRFIADLDPNFNFPFIRNQLIPLDVFMRISGNVLDQIKNIIKVTNISENSVIRIFQILQTYKMMNMPLNSFFVKKIFANFVKYKNLCEILKLKLFDRVESDYDREKCFSSVIDCFCIALNEIIKKNGDVDELYELIKINFNFDQEKWKISLLNAISAIHLKRIRKSTEINELKTIKQSILKSEKTFEKQDEKIKIKLKDKANSLIKSELFY
jgi:hypothetical protein